jgi:pimeloyl-ACP methyl ester carboxylesterase
MPKNLETLKIDVLAKDLNVVLEELKITKPIMLGHSMGVNVVLDYYRQFPEKVRAMVLANGTAKRPLETLFGTNTWQGIFYSLRKLYKTAPEVFKKMYKLQKGNPLTRTLVSMGGFNPHLTPKDDINLYIDQVEEMDPGVLLELIYAYDQFDATPWLDQIKVPTLILAGDQDKITPLAEQELMHQLIPNSQLEIIRHGSHCPQMDLPELVNARIEKFLKEQT